MYDTISFNSEYMCVREITQDVKDIVAKSGVKSGLCVVFNPHTTASVGITSFWDKRGHEDIQDEFDRLFPLKVNYNHVETPYDAAGHVKSAIMGLDLNLIIENGELELGSSQGIFFFEFDGPRPREVYVKCFAEK